MPALRPCPGDGGRCHELVPRGMCSTHARAKEQQRGSASARGYTSAWNRFRPKYIRMLIQANVVPVCGASLPGGPDVRHLSKCHQQGELNGTNLHLHHEPPLTEAERQDERAVADPMRIGVLCRTCHAAVTATALGQGGQW